MLAQALGLLLVPLLLLTSFWCMLVFRRLHALQVGREELKAFLDALSHATARAERAIQELKSVGAEAAATLAEQEKTLLAQRQELDRALESGTRIARRLEDMIGQGARIVAELRTVRDMRQAPTPERRDTAAATVEAAGRPGKQPDTRPAAGDLIEALKKLR